MNTQRSVPNGRSDWVGTGKTAVLELILERAEVVGSRVLLLAPTGKVRVRLGTETERPGDAQTVAQFLLALDRFATSTGRYFPNAKAAKAEATCCIIDESSMMTEDMLAAVVDALPPACRLILVGDPYQLPPIGAGCPFVDITSYLQTHRSTAVAELTVSRRQQDVDRTDSQLAAGQRAVFSKGSSRSMAGRNSRRLCGDARGVSIWNEAARRHQGHQRKARADRPFVRARAWAPLYANGE
jgi:ATP-dependent exoDNAse (exonuclease V) alpha subunit